MVTNPRDEGWVPISPRRRRRISALPPGIRDTQAFVGAAPSDAESAIPPESVEGGAAGILRSLIMAKTKNTVRLISFKAFKPKEKSLSWSRALRKEAERKQMTLGEYLRKIFRGEGFLGIARRFLPGYVGNAASSIALFSTYTQFSPYVLTVEWKPPTNPPTQASALDEAAYGHGGHFQEVVSQVFPCGVAAGLVHALVALPAKTVLASHYSREPLWFLFEPWRADRLKPGMSVSSGGDLRGAGARLLVETAKKEPWRLLHQLSDTVLAHRMLQPSQRIALIADPLAFGIFFATYEALKRPLVSTMVNAWSDVAWAKDKEIVVSATTAAIAGGCAGTAYSVVRVPMKWVTDPVLSCGRGLKSREFMTHLARSAMRQSLPNALAFVAIEVFLHYSGVH